MSLDLEFELRRVDVPLPSDRLIPTGEPKHVLEMTRRNPLKDARLENNKL